MFTLRGETSGEYSFVTICKKGEYKYKIEAHGINFVNEGRYTKLERSARGWAFGFVEHLYQLYPNDEVVTIEFISLDSRDRNIIKLDRDPLYPDRDFYLSINRNKEVVWLEDKGGKFIALNLFLHTVEKEWRKW